MFAERVRSTDLTQPTQPPTIWVAICRLKNPRNPMPLSGWSATVSENREEAIHGALREAAGIQGIGEKGPGVAIYLGKLTEELELVETKGRRIA